MSTLRKPFLVAWNNGDSVKVTTNAWDMAAAQEYMDNPMKGTFVLIHHALKREGYEVPSLDDFIACLDEMEALEGIPDEPHPTQSVASMSAP